MRIAILQNNPRIGDVEKNVAWIVAEIEQIAQTADLIVLPELALIGYPPQDLLSQPRILDREAEGLKTLQALSAKWGLGILVGHCERRDKRARGRPLFNAATLFDSGTVLHTVRKQRLPNYDIFDETRFFEEWSGPSQNPVLFRGKKLAFAICEDNWNTYKAFGVRDVRSYEKYPNPFQQLTEPVDLLINISASPFAHGKGELREDLFKATAQRLKTPLIYATGVGGQTHLLFDGRSFAVAADGTVKRRARAFHTDTWTVDLKGLNETREVDLDPSSFNFWNDLGDALVMGLKDFVGKNSASRVLIGLSGGVDSALVATLAVRALGPENVTGVLMPSTFNSAESSRDAQLLAERLGIKTRVHPIQAIVDTLAQSLEVPTSGLAYENAQSRARGITLMTLSNLGLGLVLATGNKSELALGYSTLYGDLCGALLPIGDLYKTEVYGLCHFFNHQERMAGRLPPIPDFTLSRPPSAELAPGQKDSDTLPAYEALDAVLFDLIENQGETQIPTERWDAFFAGTHTVAGIRRKLHAQEFKRHQAPPILRVHQRSFARGWNFPVAKGDV